MVEFISFHDFLNGFWNIFMDAAQIITQGSGLGWSHCSDLGPSNHLESLLKFLVPECNLKNINKKMKKMCSYGLQMSCCDDLEVWDAEIPANFNVWQILNTETVNVPEKDHIVLRRKW